MQGKEGAMIPPLKPSTVPASAQWLSGQGAGVWFYIEVSNNQYLIQRFSAQGVLDCEGLFELETSDKSFDISSNFSFEHISHCAKCRISQSGELFVFNRLATENQ